MWPNPQFPADLVTFTEEILNGKLHFLWSNCFENFRKIYRETLIPGYLFVIVVGLQSVALLKKDSGKNCFLVSFAILFRTAYL